MEPTYKTSLLVAGMSIAVAVMAAPVEANTGGPVFNAGTKVAHAFIGCAPLNCDILRVVVNPFHSHTAIHGASATHSGGFPPAYEMRIVLQHPITGAISLIPGCPEFFSPGSGGNLQVCTVPAQASDMIVRAEVEYLRPHLVGTVTFNHGLIAI